MADEFNLGRHEALIQQLVDGQSRIAAGQETLISRVASVEQSLAERRGERRVAAGVIGFAGGWVGAGIAFLAKAMIGAHS